VHDLVEQFLARRSPNTRRAYDSDLRDFATFLGEPTPVAAMDKLIRSSPAQANLIVMQYQQHMSESDTTPATRNRRLSAIRSALKLGRTLGLLTWAVEIQGEKVRAYKDTAGPGKDAYRAMLTVASPRDAAILHLMHDLGLRRGEIVELDLEHLNLAKRKLSIQGKGQAERQMLKLPLPTCRALRAWLAVRKREPGPLFIAIKGRHKGHRLSGRHVHRLIGKYGRDVGASDVRPHGIRHTAITQVLELTKGNVAAATAFARHASPQTTMRYLDNLNDLAAKAAELVAEAAELQPSEKPDPPGSGRT
jgi:integrase/recombinase XerC